MEEIRHSFTKNKINVNLNMPEPNPDNINRLCLAFMEKDGCSEIEAEKKLSSLKLYITCGKNIHTHRSTQVSLLSAINMGVRAFLGGVYVYLPGQVKSLVNWPTCEFLNEIVVQLGGIVTDSDSESDDVLYIGEDELNLKKYRLFSNEWQGGILIPGDDRTLRDSYRNNNSCLGSIAAASIGVGILFLQKSGIQSSRLIESKGISLWRPDLHWLDSEAYGPKVHYLPKNLWIIGLGHLGQAYLWDLSFLPFKSPSDVMIFLQDQDKVVQANISSSLLTNNNSIRKFKTRICSDFLEERGFQTRITERFADENLQCFLEEEPQIALCGLDNPSSRLKLEKSKFAYLIDCGLGGSLSSFDEIMISSNPGQNDYSFWRTQATTSKKVLHPKVESIINNNLNNKCGILATDIAGKAISSSFIGGLAGTIVLSELLRGLNDGKRFRKLSIRLRNLDGVKASDAIDFKSELVPNGYTTIE